MLFMIACYIVGVGTVGNIVDKVEKINGNLCNDGSRIMQDYSCLVEVS
jgi:hypothetical protein